MKAEIIGDDIQAVSLELAPEEQILAEPGSLFFKDPEIQMDTGLKGGLWDGIKRTLVGENLFLTQFKNTSTHPKSIGFSAPFIGKIIEIDLSQNHRELVVQRGAFLCGTADLNIDIALSKKLGAGFFGGEGFVLQRITGAGKVYLQAGGTLIPKTLTPGESIQVETGSLVGKTKDIDFSIEQVGGFKNLFFGGEGLFMTTLTGPGTVWLQTLPFSKISQTIHRAVLKTAKKAHHKNQWSELLRK